MEQTVDRSARRAYRGARHRAPSSALSGRSRRRPPTYLWLVLFSGLAGVLLLALRPGSADTDQDQQAVAPGPAIGLPRETDPIELTDQTPTPASASRTAEPEVSESASPTPTPASSPTPTPTPTASPSPSQSPTPGPTAQPVLLGPDGAGELAAMVESYCDRHVSGSSSASARSDGRWECRRFLASPRIVNMDTACRDRYGADAYAQNSTGDAYDWRCYHLQAV
ncbi:hypothetical protein ONA91_17240 [Micromonospora sp. DR5-3]|uniref:hypothetical protein n=1 Tax=unclassified Micromonospora TaxID=2617518 RepID=UPI001651E46D|nr:MULTISPECIES: hypothetical protein [unclassified Micromonospora]MCW3816191.1 hypothetical protein [Micromonospora sp. DR5-3]